MSTAPSERKAPLYANVDQKIPADFAELMVIYKGTQSHLNIWLEVDVLGCWGVRVMRDDYGNIMHDDDGCMKQEKVYGKFELKYVEPQQNVYYDPYAGYAGPIPLGHLTYEEDGDLLPDLTFDLDGAALVNNRDADASGLTAAQKLQIVYGVTPEYRGHPDIPRPTPSEQAEAFHRLDFLRAADKRTTEDNMRFFAARREGKSAIEKMWDEHVKADKAKKHHAEAKRARLEEMQRWLAEGPVSSPEKAIVETDFAMAEKRIFAYLHVAGVKDPETFRKAQELIKVAMKQELTRAFHRT